MSRGARKGFTLVELLVATILLSIVMASVYTMFYAVLVPWRAVERDYDAYRTGRNAMTLIDRELENVVPRGAHLFEGTDDEVTVIVVDEPMDVEKSEGRHVMQVRYRFNKAKGEVVREEALVMSPLPPLPEEGKEVEKSRLKLKEKRAFVIASNVVDFSIRYVWLPRPTDVKPDSPPPHIQPMFAKRHDKKWKLGYPQGIEFTLTLRDAEKKGATQEVTKTVLLRASGFGRTLKQLTEKMGGALST